MSDENFIKGLTNVISLSENFLSSLIGLIGVMPALIKAKSKLRKI
jgi:hypothetical protein